MDRGCKNKLKKDEQNDNVYTGKLIQSDLKELYTSDEMQAD